MCSMTDVCFLCTKDFKCVSVDDKIVTQIKYVLPEITIFKLGLPLRICSVCDGALYAFSKFKQFYVETSRSLEARIKGAQGPPLHTGSPFVVDDNESSDANPEKMEEISIKEEYVEETPLDTQMHTNMTFLDPIVLFETISAEPHTQLHKDSVSQNIQLHTDSNSDNTEEIFFIMEEDMEDIILKEECVSNSTNDNTDGQPEHNTENEIATLNISEQVWEGSFVDSEEETDGNYSKNMQTDTKKITHKTINQNELKKKHLCSVCTELFPCKALLVRHMKKNHWRIKHLSCTLCKKSFVHKFDLNKHMGLHTGIKNFSCSICKKRFFNKQNLKQHSKLHTERKESETHAPIQILHSLSCSVCKKIFKSKTLLNQHIKTHSRIKDFACDICDKTFTLKRYLNKHKKIHSGIKDFSCEICSRSFMRKYHLTHHMMIHSGEKEFFCDLCGKPFITKSALRYHMKTHSGKKDFRCVICNKSFMVKSALPIHMKIHFGIKDFRCEICGKSFTQKGQLINHKKLHSGVKDYRCEICEKLFTQQSQLINHMKNHTCHICGKSYKYKWNLIRHKEIHSEVKGFQCNVCHKQFSHKHNLLAHQEIHSRKQIIFFD